MNDNFAKAQAEATGGGQLGRLILLADITTLPPPLLHLCVRDLIANMISINESAVMLRTLFAPETLDKISYAPGGAEIVQLIQAVQHNHDYFETYGDVVRAMIGHSSALGEDIEPQVAQVTRLWAYSAMMLRDSVTTLKQQLHIVLPTSQQSAPLPQPV